MVTVRIFDTPVKIKFTVLPIVFALWGGLTWWGITKHPERGFWQSLFIAFVTALLLLLVEYGHPIAHIFSARYAKAPMDEILIGLDMARTIYFKNDVSPNTHRIRAIGGLIYNLLGLLLGLGVFLLVPANSLAREFTAWFAVGNGCLLIMSSLPLPMVDGGTILKWTLVAKGKKEMEAEAILTRIDRAMGFSAVILGIGLLVLKLWVAGAILVGVGAAFIGVASGKIR